MSDSPRTPIEIDQPPEPFDPAELERMVEKASHDLDELQSKPEVRPLHDIIQDSMMPVIKLMQEQIAALAFYMTGHEDRITDLEEEDDSRLVPEDAKMLLSYLTRCEELFRSLSKKHAADYPGIETMADAAVELINLVNSITIEIDEDDRPPMN